MRAEKPKESVEIEPLVGCAAQGAIVEVESIYIHNCATFQAPPLASYIHPYKKRAAL
jgi:hypothetical protein